MSEPQEKFTNDKWRCLKCKEPKVYYTSDATYDGAYDRYHYHCHGCGHKWSVVEEID